MTRKGEYMKNLCFATLMLVLLTLCLSAETVKLPDIDSLKPLPLTLVADFTDHDDVASPTLPTISKDGKIFFVDAKLKQAVISAVKDTKLIKIAGSGEGPKEYALIAYDVLIAGNRLYLVDYKRKMLCFDLEGHFKWEKRFRRVPIEKLLGVDKDRIYTLGGDFTKDGKMIMVVHALHKENEPLRYHGMPVLYTTGSALLEGKMVNDAGIFPVCKPAAALINGNIVTAHHHEYVLERFKPDGTLIDKIKLDAPNPKFAENQQGNAKKFADQVYAVRNIFPYKNGMAVISNYFVGKNPRIDFFSAEGKLEKSFILPLPLAEETKLMRITGDYMVCTDAREIGFEVYTINI